jgi:hypothetical protein
LKVTEKKHEMQGTKTKTMMNEMNKRVKSDFDIEVAGLGFDRNRNGLIRDHINFASQPKRETSKQERW